MLNNNNWSGNVESCSGSDCWGGTSGGYYPSFDGSTFRWGYNGGAINQTIAINNALQQSGIQVDGFRYHWHIKNYNANTQFGSAQDPFVITVDVYKANGDLYKTYEFDYSYSIPDWRHFGEDVYFPDSGLSPSFFGNLNLNVEGDDAGYWAGHYGPEFYPINFNLIYSANPCHNNPLYDPSCDGYAEAYAQFLYDQNCTADPLYDSGCPGYTQAFYEQQCNANPLYDVGCPNYAQAYYDQQCSIDPLYAETCPGYEQAYYDQQCSIDSLYDTQCPNYASAYYDLQCSLDALYDSGCTGYEEAYAAWQLDQVCSANPQADPRCPNYVAQSEQSTETEISTTSEAITGIVDTEEIGKPSTTGDATVDSVLREIADVPTTTVVMESSTVETVPTVQETQETERETETSAEASSAREMEELVADVSESSSDVEESSEGTDDSGESESSESDSDSDSKDEGKKDSKREKLKKAIAKKATQLAEQMSQAASLEAQQASQATVLALINYVPDFNTYSRMMNGGYLPDATGYPDTNVPESRRGLRNGLAQQLLHEKMVEMQYENLNR